MQNSQIVASRLHSGNKWVNKQIKTKFLRFPMFSLLSIHFFVRTGGENSLFQRYYFLCTYVFFGESSTQVHYPFFKTVFFFLLLSCRSSLYMLDISHCSLQLPLFTGKNGKRHVAGILRFLDADIFACRLYLHLPAK